MKIGQLHLAALDARGVSKATAYQQLAIGLFESGDYTRAASYASLAARLISDKPTMRIERWNMLYTAANCYLWADCVNSARDILLEILDELEGRELAPKVRELYARCLHGLAHTVSENWCQIYRPGEIPIADEPPAIPDASGVLQYALDAMGTNRWVQRVRNGKKFFEKERNRTTRPLVEDLSDIRQGYSFTAEEAKTTSINLHLNNIAELQKIEFLTESARDQIARSRRCLANEYMSDRDFTSPQRPLELAVAHWAANEALLDSRDTTEYARTLRALGTMWFARSRPDKANACFEKAMTLLAKSEALRSAYATCLLNYALFQERGATQLEYLMRARQLFSANRDYRDLAHIDFEISKVHRASRPFFAAQWLKSAILWAILWGGHLPHADRNGAEETLAELLTQLHDVCIEAQSQFHFLSAMPWLATRRSVAQVALRNAKQSIENNEPLKAVDIPIADFLPAGASALIVADCSSLWVAAFFDHARGDWTVKLTDTIENPAFSQALRSLEQLASGNYGCNVKTDTFGIAETPPPSLEELISDVLVHFADLLPTNACILLSRKTRPDAPTRKGPIPLHIWPCGRIARIVPWGFLPVGETHDSAARPLLILDTVIPVFSSALQNRGQLPELPLILESRTGSKFTTSPAVASSTSLELLKNSRSFLQALEANWVSLLHISGHSLRHARTGSPGIQFGTSKFFADELPKIRTLRNASIILSACNVTGSLTDHNEDWASLCRSFAERGATSALGAAWVIPEDPGTRAFEMEVVNHHLRADRSPIDQARLIRELQLNRLKHSWSSEVRAADAYWHWLPYCCITFAEPAEKAEA